MNPPLRTKTLIVLMLAAGLAVAGAATDLPPVIKVDSGESLALDPANTWVRIGKAGVCAC